MLKCGENSLIFERHILSSGLQVFQASQCNRLTCTVILLYKITRKITFLRVLHLFKHEASSSLIQENQSLLETGSCDQGKVRQVYLQNTLNFISFIKAALRSF